MFSLLVAPPLCESKFLAVLIVLNYLLLNPSLGPGSGMNSCYFLNCSISRISIFLVCLLFESIRSLSSTSLAFYFLDFLIVNELKSETPSIGAGFISSN